MRLRSALLALLSPAMALAATLNAAHAAAPTPDAIVKSAPASAWKTIPADRLLLMTLTDGSRIVIELARAFAPTHVANVVHLAQAHAFDQGAITRVQDNYVVQWRVRDEKAPLPAGFTPHPAAEYARPRAGITLHPLDEPDAYAPQSGFAEDWAVGSDGRTVWPAQCYGVVGVGRDMPPDTGDGRELYVINGQAPRQLDRNLAVIGRVLTGMDHLSALPRGTGPLGFYTDPRQYGGIRSLRLVADLPAGHQPHMQVMRTESPSFKAYTAARAARQDPFFVQPAHGAALCNLPVPARSAPATR